ncbi:hypothetical protein, partial [Stagnihabitans tardus]|uniref:hypothetical protein n=1 Tax=Stagnihabitans tardus TaxID=2699202 RepID=UPI001D0F54CE
MLRFQPNADFLECGNAANVEVDWLLWAEQFDEARVFARAEAVWKLGGPNRLGRKFSQFLDFGSDWSHVSFWAPPVASEKP